MNKRETLQEYFRAAKLMIAILAVAVPVFMMLLDRAIAIEQRMQSTQARENVAMANRGVLP